MKVLKFAKEDMERQRRLVEQTYMKIEDRESERLRNAELSDDSKSDSESDAGT